MDLRPGAPPKLGQGTGSHRLALADDRDPVRKRLDLGEDVTGQQNGDALGGALADDLLERLLHQRIHGMDFDRMPELHWRYGYFMVLGLIAAGWL